jgi:hypothetical protein
MKTKLMFFCLLGMLLAIAGCQKEDLREDFARTIDPSTQPGPLNRALGVNGSNKSGSLPSESSNSATYFVSTQSSASISPDNDFYLPFVFESNNSLQGIYLSIVGADNYWDIPVNDTGSNVHVESIGIPQNVAEGEFTFEYRLYDASGNVSTSAMLRTSVVALQTLCGPNQQTISVSGNDGVDAKDYNLGNKAGWVTLTCDMYSVPDRIDIKYNGDWIRSTGTLMGRGQNPPAKQCGQLTSGDGYTGGGHSFQFFYDPAISTKMLVYMNGCMDGGTAWEYAIQECPKDIVTLGIHSNVEPNASVTAGHAWISLTNQGITETYGLWPDAHSNVPDSGPGNDIRTGVEKGVGVHSYYFPLESDQLSAFTAAIGENKTWGNTYNCSSWVEEVVNRVTDISITANDPGALFLAETPRRLSAIIIELERNAPTTTFAPPGEAEDSSSCSFCF